MENWQACAAVFMDILPHGSLHQSCDWILDAGQLCHLCVHYCLFWTSTIGSTNSGTLCFSNHWQMREVFWKQYFFAIPLGDTSGTEITHFGIKLSYALSEWIYSGVITLDKQLWSITLTLSTNQHKVTMRGENLISFFISW